MLITTLFAVAQVTLGGRVLIETAPRPDPQSAFPVRLEQVSLGPAGIAWIDPASIKRDGDRVEVRSVAIPPEQSGAASHYWSLERIDCSARTLEKLLQVNFNESGQELNRRSSPPVTIPDGAQANLRIDRVCKGAEDSAKTRAFKDTLELLRTSWPLIDAEIARLP